MGVAVASVGACGYGYGVRASLLVGAVCGGTDHGIYSVESGLCGRFLLTVLLCFCASVLLCDLSKS